MRPMLRLAVVLLAAVAGAPAAQADETGASPGVVRLESPKLQMEISPRLGGRVLHFSLPGAPNLLRIGAAVASQPDPKVSAAGENLSLLHL